MHSVIGFISSKFIPKKKQHIAVGVYVTCSTKAYKINIINHYIITGI